MKRADMSRAGSFALILIAALQSSGVNAHAASDSYLYVDPEMPGALRLDIALQDLQLAVDLDADGDGAVTWREIDGARAPVTSLIQRGLRISSRDGNCPLEVELVGVTRYREQAYTASLIRMNCPGGAPVSSMRYSLLFDRDALHRAVVTRKLGGGYQVETLSPDRPVLRWSGRDIPLLKRAWQRIRRYLLPL